MTDDYGSWLFMSLISLLHICLHGRVITLINYLLRRQKTHSAASHIYSYSASHHGLELGNSRQNSIDAMTMISCILYGIN